MNISWYIKDITTQYGLQDYGAEKLFHSHIIHCFSDMIYGIDRILRGAGAPELGLSAFAAVVEGADFLWHAAEEKPPQEAHPIPEVRQDDA